MFMTGVLCTVCGAQVYLSSGMQTFYNSCMRNLRGYALDRNINRILLLSIFFSDRHYAM